MAKINWKVINGAIAVTLLLTIALIIAILNAPSPCPDQGKHCEVHPPGCNSRGATWKVSGTYRCVNGQQQCVATDLCRNAGGDCGDAWGMDCGVSGTKECVPNLECVKDPNNPSRKMCDKIPGCPSVDCWTKAEVGTRINCL